MGTLSQADLEKVQKNIGTELYPVSPWASILAFLLSVAHRLIAGLQSDYQPKTMDNPSTSESRICVFTRELAKTLRYSPYRLTDETGKDGKRPHTLFTLFSILLVRDADS